MNRLEHKILVVGLPQTGKTTFLAALWDVVGTDDVEGSLRLERLNGDKQHLNDLRDLWSDCHRIPRTRVVNEKVVSMLLQDSQTGATSEVSFSDMSGESFEKQWTERVCTPIYNELVRESSGILLFIHPEMVREAALIRDAQALIGRIVERDAITAMPDEPDFGGEATIPTAPRYAATQVQVVDLLQFVNHRRRSAVGLRIGVIISAWDLVRKVERRKTPEAWLSERLPLVHQFLLAASDLAPYRVFGVSAQGGDLASDVDSLRKSHRASDRIVVAHGQRVSRDITAPVRWAMGIRED